MRTRGTTGAHDHGAHRRPADGGGRGLGADRPQHVVPRRRQRGRKPDHQPDRGRLQREPVRLARLHRELPAGKLQRFRRGRGAGRQPARHPRRRRAGDAELGLVGLHAAAAHRRKPDRGLPARHKSATGTGSSTRSASGTRRWRTGARQSDLDDWGLRTPTLDEPWTGKNSWPRSTPPRARASTNTPSIPAWPGPANGIPMPSRRSCKASAATSWIVRPTRPPTAC
jgi:hypothetical protein